MSKHGDTLVQHTFWKASVLKSTVIAWDLKLKILCFLRAFLVLQLLKINLPRLLRLPTFRNSESGIKGDSACSEVKKTSWGQGVLETEEEDWFTQITAINFFSKLPGMVLETEEDDTDRESLGRKMVEELPAAKLQEFTEIFSFFDRFSYFLCPK